MTKLVEVLEKPLSRFADEIGKNNVLMSIRDAFIFTLPFVIISSMLTVINWIFIFNIGLTEGFIFEFATKCGELSSSLSAVQGLLIVIAVGYFYSSKLVDIENFNKVTGMLIAFIAYFVLVPNTFSMEGVEAPINAVQTTFTNYESTIVGLIAAFTSIKLYSVLIVKVPTIKLPGQVPPAIFNSFFALIPITIIVFVFEFVNVIINTLGFSSANELITMIIVTPLEQFGTGLFAMLLVMLVMQLLWFFGLHGFSIIWGVVGVVWLPFFQKQLEVFAQTGDTATLLADPAPNVIALIYGMIGGSGCTLGLVIAIFILAKKTSYYRSIAKVALVPSLFNINEPVIFGIPIVLNPLMFFPFMLIPLVNIIIAYFAHVSGLVAPIIAAGSGAEPIFINVFALSGGQLSPVILYGVLLIVDIILWYPFAKMILKREESEENL